MTRYEQQAQKLKALAHPLRLQILEELCVHKCNVSALCKRLGAPQSTISRHLGVLRSAGIISGNRSGLEVDYALDCGRLESLIKQLTRDE